MERVIRRLKLSEAGQKQGKEDGGVFVRCHGTVSEIRHWADPDERIDLDELEKKVMGSRLDELAAKYVPVDQEPFLDGYVVGFKVGVKEVWDKIKHEFSPQS